MNKYIKSFIVKYMQQLNSYKIENCCDLHAGNPLFCNLASTINRIMIYYLLT